jgi:hypothetical protein
MACHKQENPMHDLLIALAFVGMVFAPAIIAARAGTDEPENDSE